MLLRLFVEEMSHRWEDALCCPFESSRVNSQQQQQLWREGNMEEM